VRPEYFVSVCVAERDDVSVELRRLPALVAQVEAGFAWWEVILTVRASSLPLVREAGPWLARLQGVRVAAVADAQGHDERRAAGARLAIGDVVVVTAGDEVEGIDLPRIAARAWQGRQAVVARASGNAGRTVAAGMLAAVTGFEVEAGHLATVAMRRDVLDVLAARTGFPVELRYRAKGGPVRYEGMDMPGVRLGRSRGGRLDLLMALFAASSERYLAAFAVGGASVSVVAVAYGAYAVAAWVMLPAVQPGWLTSSLALSGSTAFVGVGLAVIALGIARLASVAGRGGPGSVVEELANASFRVPPGMPNVERTDGAGGVG